MRAWRNDAYQDLTDFELLGGERDLKRKLSDSRRDVATGLANAF
jgi:hypothetical protein